MQKVLNVPALFCAGFVVLLSAEIATADLAGPKPSGLQVSNVGGFDFFADWGPKTMDLMASASLVRPITVPGIASNHGTQLGATSVLPLRPIMGGIRSQLSGFQSIGGGLMNGDGDETASGQASDGDGQGNGSGGSGAHNPVPVPGAALLGFLGLGMISRFRRQAK